MSKPARNIEPIREEKRKVIILRWNACQREELKYNNDWVMRTS